MLPSQYLEKGWTQGSFAIDINGALVSVRSTNAVCWCLTGAIEASYRHLNYNEIIIYSITEEIKKITGAKTVIWNDTKGRTQEEVVKLMKQVESNLGLV